MVTFKVSRGKVNVLDTEFNANSLNFWPNHELFCASISSSV